jgi:hypothetical protein
MKEKLKKLFKEQQTFYEVQESPSCSKWVTPYEWCENQKLITNINNFKLGVNHATATTIKRTASLSNSDYRN